MFRIDSSGAVASKPSVAALGEIVGYFQEGNPALGIEPTQVSADWLNAVQEEIVAVIAAAGIILDKAAQPTQLLSAILALTGLAKAPATLTTTNDTVASLDSIDLAEGQNVLVRAEVSARNADGSERYNIVLISSFYRNAGGVITQDGDVSVSFINDSTSSDWGGADLAADAINQKIKLQVTGKAATTITWKGRITIL